MSDDNYFLIKGTPEEWIKEHVYVAGHDFYNLDVVDEDGDYRIVLIKPSLTDLQLTKPTIRVPVWGQEFKVQGVKMEKGVICVDVTPPVIKDQYGNVLPATAWVNDQITVKTPPKTGSIMPESSVSETQAAILVKENERLKSELETMTAKMTEFRENYRKEHERANKLQDSEGAARRDCKAKAEELGYLREEYKKLEANLAEAKAGWEKAATELKEMTDKYNEAWDALYSAQSRCAKVNEEILALSKK